MYRSPKTTEVERSRLLAYIPLFIASVMFWAIQNKEQRSLPAMRINDKVRICMGFTISPAWFQSFNPLFIITVSAIICMDVGEIRRSSAIDSTKILFRIIIRWFIIPCYSNTSLFWRTDSLVNPLWLVLSYFIVVLGELCLSPVGLSAATKLAPAAFSAQTMSLWFLSNAAAQAINAQLLNSIHLKLKWCILV